MNPVSRRHWLAAATAGGIATAAASVKAATFGNPDEPPQGAVNTTGNPASAADPGPQNPALTRQFPGAFSPPATDTGDLPMFWASFNNAPRRIQDGLGAPGHAGGFRHFGIDLRREHAADARWHPRDALAPGR